MIDLLLLLVLFGPAAKRVNAIWTRPRARASRSHCPPHRTKAEQMAAQRKSD